MNASRFVPSGVSVVTGGVPVVVVVAIDPFGLISAVKPWETRLPAVMSADVTGINVESGISFLTASVCSASQNVPPPPLTAQSPVVPLTFGPLMNSGFDGIVAAPVYRPIFGLTSCCAATGKLTRPDHRGVALLRPASLRLTPLAASDAPSTSAAPE